MLPITPPVSPTPKRWKIAAPITAHVTESLAAYPPILRQILFNRGFTTESEAASYLHAEAPEHTSPWKMTGIEPAVQRILAALKSAEPIAIYGDYDVDGVTATALLVLTLQAQGGDVRGYIPNRFEEGYGLNKEALDLLQAEGVRLVITVDCGIRSPEEAAHARAIGLDLIISDHHQPAAGELPPALAVINPKQEGEDYPDKDLAGVGLAYKLAQALLERRPAEGLHADQLLDLVALGTVADLAPLVGENRFLVYHGLQRIRSAPRQGIFSLANVSDLPLARINANAIGYILGPRLNAAGRLDSALAAFDLLTTQDVQQAGALALKLDQQNRERQSLTRKIQEQAEAQVQADDPEALVLFAVNPEFNAGVVGLAASRLVDSFYRPAVVGQQFADTTRCSCRSIPEFHITQALDQCADLLLRYGGHAAAAGFTVRNDRLPELKRRLLSIAADALDGQDLRRTLHADIEVPFSDLQSGLLKHLDALQPTGFGNPEAVFVSRNVTVLNSRVVGSDGKHLKMGVSDGRVNLDAIGFRLGAWHGRLPPAVDLLYTFEMNEFNGRSMLQLNVKDLKPAGTPE